MKFFVSLLLAASLMAIPAYAQEESPGLADPPTEEQLLNAGSVEGLDDSLAVPSVPDSFARGRVRTILEDDAQEILGRLHPYQKVEIELGTGPDAGTMVTIEHGRDYSIRADQTVKLSQTVIVGRSELPTGEVRYYIADVYRLPTLWMLLALFFVAAVAIARLKGLLAVGGLVVSVVVLWFVVIKPIVGGTHPLLASLEGALIISLVSIYLAHGFTRRTTLALVSTLLTLGMAAMIAVLTAKAGQLIGLGSEATTSFQFGPLANVNLQGLFLGGVILGVLGVLDDITTAQAATVDELHQANRTLSDAELTRGALSVGKEHITSLVNTLFLAYAGAGLPFFLYLAIDQSQPWWVVVNGQFVAEEIVRTVVGSLALVLAVPITTWITVRFLNRTKV